MVCCFIFWLFWIAILLLVVIGDIFVSYFSCFVLVQCLVFIRLVYTPKYAQNTANTSKFDEKVVSFWGVTIYYVYICISIRYVPYCFVICCTCMSLR